MLGKRIVPLPWLSIALGVLLAFAVASPLAAFTIYFKDGSKLIARDRYRVEGDKAYIVLPNGTETIYAASQIDTARTERANRSDYGTALVLEDGKVKEVAIEDVPRRGQPTLRDLITSGAAGPSKPPDSLDRPTTADLPEPTTDLAPSGPPRTPAGFNDLARLERRGFADLDLAGELSQEFLRHEVPEVHIYQGTAAKRPLVEVITGSEASVFRAIRIAAVGLYTLEERYPGQIEAIELLLITPKGARAGQFVITPEMVEELKGVDTPTFFLRHVEF